MSLPEFEVAKATLDHSAAVDVLNREGAAGWDGIGLSALGDASAAVFSKRPTTDGRNVVPGRPSRPETGRSR